MGEKNGKEVRKMLYFVKWSKNKEDKECTEKDEKKIRKEEVEDELISEITEAYEKSWLKIIDRDGKVIVCKEEIGKDGKIMVQQEVVGELIDYSQAGKLEIREKETKKTIEQIGTVSILEIPAYLKKRIGKDYFKREGVDIYKCKEELYILAI